MRKGIFTRLMSFLLVTILGIVPSMTAIGTLPVQAKTTAGSGSYADSEEEVVGTWSYSYQNENKEWIEVTQNNKDLLTNLPNVANTNYRYTTSNYDSNHGAFDTTDWGTSFMWNVNGDNPYSNTVYAIPLAFRAGITHETSSAIKTANVIQVTAPSMIMDTAGNAYTMQMPAAGTMTDFFIKTSFVTSAAKVDDVSDWGYDIHLEKSGDANTYLELKMLQGSIFGYFELVNDNTLTIERGKGLPASVIYTSEGGNVIIVRCYDNADEDYDYYAFYGATGTSFTTTMNGNTIASIAVNFSDGKYMSLAYLGSSSGSPDDMWATNMCNAYLPYAYNFVIDTQATYSYDEATSKVTTTYTYTVDKKAESTADGTIMGVLPHQYKNMSADTPFLDYTYKTVRGTMRTMAGSSFTTELEYSGILPFMPDYSDEEAEEAVLAGYLDEFTNTYSEDYFDNYDGSGDTYWDGKGMNRLVNAMAVAEAAGDDRATGMLAALKNRLADWFTYTEGGEDSRYFYYDDGVGSLFGFPQSYNSVDQMNDHHFHYGYFIYAAAQVAFRDSEWKQQYQDMVNELIYDIACPVRNNADSKYPYLRAFSPYEGHSWASGHGNFDMGNNQESSSEALNAWAGIILWGEATGNDTLRDLGIYLYTTEVSAVENYWYDVDEDVLADEYRYDVEKAGSITAQSEEKFTSAAIVWGGSYTYATWFSANPLYIQGINLLPMNPTCFYLAGNKDYINQNYTLAYKYASEGTDPVSGDPWDTKSWFDIWCQYYAMAYPETALTKWQETVDGEGYGVEGSDTKAHTYHFMKALCTYGTPDTSVTSNATLSSVFVKDGVKTYCAYNADATEKTVKFSDGYQITVAPGALVTETAGTNANMTTYTVEYYTENSQGGYDLHSSESRYALKGESLSVTTKKDILGYEFDEGNAGNILSATAAEDGSTILKVYYNRKTYTIQYVLNGGTQNAENPSTYKYGDEFVFLAPTLSGYEFTGWYTNEALTTAVSGITSTTNGNLVLYAGWRNPYEYQLDSYKKVSYEDDKIVFTVENVSAEDSVYVYYGIYNNESEFSGIISQAGVAGLTGQALTYDSTLGVWKYEITSGFATDQYIVFKIKVEIGAIGEESAWGVYQIPAEDPSMITYYENHYKEGTNGTYELAESVRKKAADGATVTCGEKTYTGFTFNSQHSGNNLTAVINGSSVNLKRYYSRNVYNISYNLNGGTVATENPATYKYGIPVSLTEPVKEGYVFGGWYTDEGCTSAFSGITATTEGDLTLWANWIDEANIASYKVEHYKEAAADTGLYSLAESQLITAPVGTAVSATPKTYEGYTENTTHENRVVSGVVSADTTLTLRLYYDADTPPNEENAKGAAIVDGKIVAWVDDAPQGTNEVKFIAQVYSNKAEAEARMEDPSDTNMPAYMMVADGDGTYSLTTSQVAISDAQQYLLYQFYIAPGGFTGWVLTTKAELEEAGQGGQDEPVNADYTVKYYQQNATLDGYTEVEADKVVANAQVASAVTAEIKTYTGFTHNPNHLLSNLNGYVLTDGSLVLSVYYDRNSYSITYNNMEDAQNPESNAATYVYGVGLTLADPTKEGFVFEGWYTDENFEEASLITAISETSAEDIVLYAKWTESDENEDEGGNESGGDNEDVSGNDSVSGNDYESPEYNFTVDTIEDKYYTGKKIIPTVIVRCGDTVLAEKRDYTVKYSKNTNVGTAEVIIKGKGNYSGTVTKNFQILPLDIAGDNFAADDIYVAYKNKAIKVSPKLKWGSKTLKLNKDYEIDGAASYSDKGVYAVVLRGKNNYTGTREISFVITDKTLMSKVSVSKIAKQYYNNGEPIEPAITAKYKKETLTEGTDYLLTYVNNQSAGTATAILTGIGDRFAGEKKVTFKILGTKLNKDDFTLKETEYEYTGNEVIPVYESKLTDGVDYVVSYTNNKKTGKGTIIFTGIGKYSGVVKKTFKINPYNIKDNKAGLFADETGEIIVDYEKGGNKPSVRLKFKGDLLQEGIHYTVKYKDNKDLGSATIMVSGKGNFKGTYEKEFTIQQKKLEDVLLIASDVVYKSGKKAPYYMSKVILTDTNGKKLAAGKDYEKKISYEVGEEPLEKTSNITNLPVGTTIKVTVTGKEYYVGEATCEYTVVADSISKAKVTITPQTYTGKQVTLTKEDIVVKVGGYKLESDQFEIVEGSYVNNIKKGTAKVTIHGIPEKGYGGYKTVSFKIGARDIKDVIGNIFRLW